MDGWSDLRTFTREDVIRMRERNHEEAMGLHVHGRALVGSELSWDDTEAVSYKVHLHQVR